MGAALVREDIEQAHRHGHRSAMITPLAVYAMVLKAWDEVAWRHLDT